MKRTFGFGFSIVWSRKKLSTLGYFCVTFNVFSDQSELAASLEEEEMLEKQERELQEKLARSLKEN